MRRSRLIPGLVHRQGPLQALRGSCGAFSGPATHRSHKLSEAREDVHGILRVHPSPGFIHTDILGLTHTSESLHAASSACNQCSGDDSAAKTPTT